MSGSHETVMGFKQPLDEMVYNICENAIKYNTENGKIDVWVGRVDGVVTLRVKDTGIGIPESEQERAFERFYRVDKSHSKETGGTGLGLSIVKHSAMLHGAVIDMESKVGVGTVMTVSFVNGEAAV
jgi:two-component system phosphate regulon sensor histidine kinase PhoR